MREGSEDGREQEVMDYGWDGYNDNDNDTCDVGWGRPEGHFHQ